MEIGENEAEESSEESATNDPIAAANEAVEIIEPNETPSDEQASVEQVAIIPEQDLLVALEEPTIARRLDAVRALLAQYFVGISTSTNEEWSRVIVGQAPDDQDLIAFLGQVQPPVIENPASTAELAQESVEFRLNEMNLSRHFNNTAELFLRFKFHLLNDRKLAELTSQKYFLHSSRLLAYVFEKLNNSLEQINNPEAVAASLSCNWVKRYIEDAIKCRISSSELSAITDSVKAMINFILNSNWARSKITLKHVVELRVQKEAIDYFTRPVKEASGALERRRKRFRMARRQVFTKTFAEIRAMFRYRATKRQLSRLITALDKSNLRANEIMEDQYNFLVQYCHAIVSIYYGKRPHVVSRMTMQEFLDRVIIDGDGNEDQPACIVKVANVKTKATHGPEEVLLTKEQESWFLLYLKIRKILWRNVSNNETLFVDFQNGQQLLNPSRTVTDFQAAIGHGPRLLQGDIRRIIETASAEHFKDEERKRNAIAMMLAHTTLTAIRSYVQEAIAENISILDCAKIMTELEKLTGGGQLLIDDTLNQNEPQGLVVEEFPNTQAVRQFLIKIGLIRMTVDAKLPTKNDILAEDYIFNKDDNPAEKQRKADQLYRELHSDQRKCRIENVVENVVAQYLNIGDANEVKEFPADQELMKEVMRNLISEETSSRGWKLGNIEDRLLPKAIRAVKQYFGVIRSDRTDQTAPVEQEQEVVEEEQEQEEESQASVQHIRTFERPRHQDATERLLEQLFGSQEYEDERENGEEEEVEVYQQPTLDTHDGGVDEPELNDQGEDGNESESDNEEPNLDNQPGPSNATENVRQPPQRGRITNAMKAAAYKRTFTEEEITERCENQDWPHLKVEDFPVRERGVVARCDISANQVICDYHGHLVKTDDLKKELDELEHRMNHPLLSPQERKVAEEKYDQKDLYRFDLERNPPPGQGLSVDASDEDNSYGRLINHTPHNDCSNVRMVIVEVKQPDGSVKKRVIL